MATEARPVEPVTLASAQREFARQQLADYKIPEMIVILAELPKGLMGRVLRRALKEMLPGVNRASV